MLLTSVEDSILPIALLNALPTDPAAASAYLYCEQEAGDAIYRSVARRERIEAARGLCQMNSRTPSFYRAFPPSKSSLFRRSMSESTRDPSRLDEMSVVRVGLRIPVIRRRAVKVAQFRIECPMRIGEQ